MKKLFLLATIIISIVAITSCSEDDPIPMEWEFSAYDQSAVTAVYTPDYVYQVSIQANPNYDGEITLRCTNYPTVSIKGNSEDGSYISREGGFRVVQENENTIKVKFSPIETSVPTSDIVMIDGKNNKKFNATTISITRHQ